MFDNLPNKSSKKAAAPWKCFLPGNSIRKVRPHHDCSRQVRLPLELKPGSAVVSFGSFWICQFRFNLCSLQSQVIHWFQSSEMNTPTTVNVKLMSSFFYPQVGESRYNGRELRSCLGQVFIFKLGSFT